MNTLVRLQVPTVERPLPSRVEDVLGDRVVLAAPTDRRGSGVRAPPGSPVLVSWTEADGLHELPAALVDRLTEPLPVWVVEPIADPVVHQRRDAFRLELHTTMSVTVGEQAVVATLLDLSEGGLRCALPADVDARPGDELQVLLPLEEDRLRLRAKVVRTVPAAGGPNGPKTAEAGCRFIDLSRDAATQVRQYLFREQLRRRALLADD